VRKPHQFMTESWWITAASALLIVTLNPLVRAQETKDQPAAAPANTAAAAKTAEPDVLAGHSNHGEAFNEGPRQKAYLMGNTGNVQFKITTKSPQAQAFFEQGVGQLHGFWYFEAERSFRQVAAIDPDCGMAYWGMARANINNEKRASELILEAVKRKSHLSKREQMWIDALARYYKTYTKKSGVKSSKTKDKQRRRDYVKDLRAIIAAYPDDLEAKAFLAVMLWQSNRKGVPIKSYEANDKLMNQVLAGNPMHPVHHYRIHTWDYKKPANALNSAARCGQSAPGIAHMWHMPGHIYSRLHRYADAAWQQEASARVDHAHMMRDQVLPDQIHNFAHNNEWLIRNLMNIGRAHDAVDLAKNMLELPRHPRYNTLRKGSARYGRMRLITVLTRFELWDQAIELCHSVYLEPTEIASEQIKRLRLLGRAYFETGKTEQGKKLIAQAQKELEKVRKDKKLKNMVSSWQSLVNELQAGELAAANDHKAALAKLKKIKSYDKVALALRYLTAGEQKNAVSTASSAVSRATDTVRPLAAYAYILHKAGQQKKAHEQFEKLHKISSYIDIETPVFARLNPLAKEMGFEADWRKPLVIPKDIGKRPKLDDLGPFRWQPTLADDWTLPDGEGTKTSLKQYRGKPVIVIFYLGAGCLHCVQQLHAFAPMTRQYADAGITLLAVSTEKPSKLIQSNLAYDPKGGVFPFTLVSDHKLGVFKQYRAYDDFEKMPLHGTFLIDGKGYIRWLDISYEPFMKSKFLLQEAKRLLAQPAGTL